MPRGVPEAILPALRHVAVLLEDLAQPWAVAASANLALRGAEVVPGDVDVVTTAEGAYAIGERLAAYSVQPVAWGETERLASHFGRFEVGGVRVEVIGDLSVADGRGGWRPARALEVEVVQVGDRAVPALALDAEALGYEAIERADRAALARGLMERA